MKTKQKHKNLFIFFSSLKRHRTHKRERAHNIELIINSKEISSIEINATTPSLFFLYSLKIELETLN